MSGYIYAYTPFIEVRLVNPFSGTCYPERGWVAAVLDTGFTGFALVPEQVFRRLGLHEQRVKTLKARTADGREVELTGAYASLVVRGLDVTIDGLVETCRGAEEFLVGMRALRELAVTLDSCTGTVILERC